MRLEVDVAGLEGVLEALSRAEDDALLRAAQKGMRKGLEEIRGDAQANAPKDEGELVEKIKTRIRMEKGGIVGEVYSAAPHSIYVEMGTGPRGEASHEGVNPAWAQEVTYSPQGWKAPIKGAVRFIRGYPARPFLYPAFKAKQGKVKKLIQAQIHRQVTGG